MALSKEQIEQLKDQLKEQVSQLPEDQKTEALKHIDDMSDEAIEMMLKQQQKGSPENQTSQSPFRMIVSGDLPSKRIDENSKAYAVLDIKPISKGHTVIIPITAVPKSEDLPTEAFELAKKVSKRIISKLKAEGTEIQTQFMFGEIIINVIPIYDKPLSINSPRQEIKPEDIDKELDPIYFELKEEKKLPIIKKRKVSSKTIKLKRKVP